MRNRNYIVIAVTTATLSVLTVLGEALTVPGSGESVQSSTILEQGVTYVLVASGTYTHGGSGQNTDAEYIFVSTQDSWLEDYPNTTGFHDMTVNGQNIDWLGNTGGTAWSAHTFSTNHVYRFYFTGQGETISLKIVDDYYGDNSGSLEIEILPAPTFAEITALSVYQTSGVGVDNVALGTNITPHSNIVLGDPLNVVDGDFSTVWYSHQGSATNEISFTLDLERDVVIGRFVHYPVQTAYYLIETSSDGAAWTNRHSDIMDSRSDAGIRTNDVFGAYSARYIRYTGQNYRSAYVGGLDFQVFEMETPHIGVSFSSLADGYYTLQRNDDLASGIWTNVVGQVGVSGNGGTVLLQDTNLYSNQFYRVQERDTP